MSALKGTIISDQVISGNFTFTDTSIEGAKIVEVKAYGDNRGYFMETHKRLDSIASGIDCGFVQDNQSSSTRGVLRGLHFQIEHPQAKLVRVVLDRVFDVAVDLRKGSLTYGKWEVAVLSAENKRQFLFLVGPRTAFSFCPILPSFATNAMMSIIPMMKAGSCGTTPPSESGGLRSMAMPSWILPRLS